MTDTKPPDETGLGNTEGTAPATNDRRPLHVEPTGNSRSDALRVASDEPNRAIDPHPIDRDGAPNGFLDFLWRLSGEPRRALVLGLLSILFLGAIVGALVLVAPHLGAVVGALGAAGLAGGGVTLAGYRRRRQDQENDQE